MKHSTIIITDEKYIVNIQYVDALDLDTFEMADSMKFLLLFF